MTKIWHDTAWDQYLNWQTQDKKTLKRINKLIKDIERNGYNCNGFWKNPRKYWVKHMIF